MSLYVTKVEGTVKGMTAAVTLGPKTLIHGPNGAGKSAIVNAVELATTGKASDVAGRPWLKAGSDLIALAPEGEPLHALVTLSNGQTASYRIERKAKNKTSRPAHVAPEGLKILFPVPDAVQALRGSTDKARAFVLRHARVALDLETLKEKFDAAKDTFLRLVGALENSTGGAFSDPMEMVLAVKAQAEKDAAAAKKTREASKDLMDRYPSRPLPTEEEVTAAALALADAQRAYEAARKLPETVNLEALQAQFNQRAEEYKAMSAQLGQYEEAFKVTESVALDEDSIRFQTALSTLHGFMAKLAQDAALLCPLCHSTIQAQPVRHDHEHKTITAQLGQIEGIRELRKNLPLLREQVAAAYARLEAEYNALVLQAQQAQEGTTGADRAAKVRETYTAYQAAIAANQALTNVASEQKARETATAAYTEAVKRDQEYAYLLVKLGDVLDEILTQGREAFVARVQSFLPETDKFDLVLREDGEDVCTFGFRRGTELHVALSGAEWARLSMALGAAAVPEGDNVLAILAPEERAFDASTLAAVMKGLSKAPGQVLLINPTRPTGKAVTGWTYLKVGPEKEKKEDNE